MTSNPTEATREAPPMASDVRRFHMRLNPISGNVYMATDKPAKDLSTEYVLASDYDALRSEVSRLRAVVEAAVRAMGDHNAPNDCYATGPLTGNPYSDLVECPACTFIKLHEKLKDPTP